MHLQKQFLEITTLIANAKQKAYQAVNRELVSLYWNIGEYVSQQVEAKAWGKSVVSELSKFIQETEPNITGFSPQNLWRMKQLYETYCQNEILSPLVREISWTNNLIILSCPSEQERAFYLRMSIKEKWSKLELQRQINASCYERVMLADAKLATLSRELPQNIAKTFKDPYILDLLGIENTYLEKDLEEAIVLDLEKFILELGNGFKFVKRQKRMIIDGDGFTLDLLFFHSKPKRLVAI